MVTIAKKEKLLKQIFLINLTAIVVLLLAAVAAGWIVYALDIDFYLAKIFHHLCSDFSQVIQFAYSDNPYLSPFLTSYTPLAVLFLYPFALICKNIIHFDFVDFIYTPQFWISYLLFILICYTAAILLLKKILKIRGRGVFYFCSSCFLTGMLWYALARGNNIILAFDFILFFLAFYKSENKVLKELSLVCLALAGILKIYPLFFGVLLLKDKEFFKSARVALYTIALFFLPFLFFEGGFANISLFLNNVLDFSGGERLLQIRNLSASGLVYKLFNIFSFGTDWSRLCMVISTLLIAAIAFVAIFCSIVSKNKFSVYIFCVGVITLIPSVSYYYVLIFLIVPMVQFINDYESFSLSRQRFYTIFFITVPLIWFCPFVNFLYQALMIIVAFVLEAISTLSIFKKEIKNKKNAC